MTKRSPALFLLLLLAVTTAVTQQPTLTPQTSNTTATLIAVSPVDDNVVWAVGTGSTYVVTTDGGLTWRAGKVPTQNGADVQLRDVQAVSAQEAYVMSIGNLPGDFAIYKTTDGGGHWTQQFHNQLVGAFYDCMAFWTADSGIAHSDSVNGVFPDIRTTDGLTWQSIANNMPPAMPAEASFSSSGTCICTQGQTNAWIATGGGAARVLATTDGGDTWAAYDTPLHSAPTAGGFTIAFRDASNGILGGGDLVPTGAKIAAQTVVSHDGGQTWTFTTRPPVGYPIFGLAYLSNTTGVGGQHKPVNKSQQGIDYSQTVVVVAEIGGAAWTPDEGVTWNKLSGVTGYWAAAFADPQNGWLVGSHGLILKVSFP